ncbi:hypothetical protein A2880_03450 [Candidatus Peribacteria bacterium RIFCSPHIGHO2_01_FULL_49_38]|nr:MAG: hypothetical protein A2880_03450 [Candidatus Peribacteria bacterium RIFCSPHIGHO2_01_FULL_49_38]
MHESPIKDLTQGEVRRATAYATEMARVTKGKCIHLPNRPVHRTIKVRGSLRVMDMCEGCYGVMDRAGCIAEVI